MLRMLVPLVAGRMPVEDKKTVSPELYMRDNVVCLELNVLLAGLISLEDRTVRHKVETSRAIYSSIFVKHRSYHCCTALFLSETKHVSTRNMTRALTPFGRTSI